MFDIVGGVQARRVHKHVVQGLDFGLEMGYCMPQCVIVVIVIANELPLWWTKHNKHSAIQPLNNVSTSESCVLRSFDRLHIRGHIAIFHADGLSLVRKNRTTNHLSLPDRGFSTIAQLVIRICRHWPKSVLKFAYWSVPKILISC